MPTVPKPQKSTTNTALREWLAANGLTTEGFAREIGVALSTVARWVGGKTHKLHFLTRKAIQEKYPDCPLLLPQPPRPTSRRPA